MTAKQKLRRARRTLLSRPVERLAQTFREFARLEAAGGLVLLAAALVALVWANSPWSEAYFNLWQTPLTVGIGSFSLSHDLHWWINEGLMVIFFFVVGLEIKREVQVGELSSLRLATLPVAAAIGGMLLPAGIYALINAGTPGARGWGIPMATDIAFALGVMALLGPRVPVGLKVFLTALAIVDDIGAVLVIALFYTGQIAWGPLAVVGVLLLVLLLANRVGVRSLIAYSVLGIGLWLAFLESGMHATMAGVLLALTIPSRGKIQAQDFLRAARTHLHEFEQAEENGHSLLTQPQQEALQALEVATERVETPLQRLEHALLPWVSYGIIPLFALANAGVALRAEAGSNLSDRISLGVIAGLVIGKPLGVSLAAWLAVRLGLADLPEGVSWRAVYSTGWLAGIGFTMSLFIAALAFGDTPAQEAAKVGILAASLIAGLGGYFLLRRSVSAEEI